MSDTTPVNNEDAVPTAAPQQSAAQSQAAPSSGYITDTLPPVPPAPPAAPQVGAPVMPAQNIQYTTLTSSTYNTYALTSMILGICGYFSMGLLCIPAVILGHLALGQLKAQPDQTSRNMAIAGLVLGYIPIAFLGLVLFFCLIILGAGALI